MDVSWKLTLPCEAASVRVARRLVLAALESAGVDSEISFEIGLAMTEACANVVEHAKAPSGYTVGVCIDGSVCRVDVIDSGVGFDLEQAPHRAADTAESGRGLSIIRELMDHVRYHRVPAGGLWVRFDKALRDADHPAPLALAG